jgi:hypothetical protein
VQLTRILTVDWSGAGPGHARRLWVAEVHDGRLVALRNGQTRDAVTMQLVATTVSARAQGERVLLGLDFAFGFPSWYLASRGWTSSANAWATFTSAAVDDVLSAPTFPFWGREPTRTRPTALREESDTPPSRATERSLRDIARPFSVFQLVGAGAVGVGSLRGMATLAALHAAGARVWPFTDDVGGPGVVVAEVWPRLAAPDVIKSNAASRRAALQAIANVVTCAPSDLAAAAESDDAFDALAAASWLWQHRALLTRLPDDSTPEEQREGRILGARTPALLHSTMRGRRGPDSPGMGG